MLPSSGVCLSAVRPRPDLLHRNLRKKPVARSKRNARRRYQATPRGRAMHAERNRRYRARVRRVTDHGPVIEQETGLLRRFEGSEALREPSAERISPVHSHCHYCGRSASSSLRLYPPSRTSYWRETPDHPWLRSAWPPTTVRASVSARPILLFDRRPSCRPDLRFPKPTRAAAVKDGRRPPRLRGAQRP